MELMLAVCLLTILLSLAVSLSRQVRAQSARALTSDVLVRLEMSLRAYSGKYGPGAIPAVVDMPTVASPAGPVADDRLAPALAERNNREFVRAVLALGPAGGEILAGLPAGCFDKFSLSVRDAWGTPVAFVRRIPVAPSGGEAERAGWAGGAFGMSPGDAPFFVSAGPDRRFSTRGDNLYSYELFSR